MRDAVPVPHTAALLVVVGQQTERYHGADEEEEVDGPVHEGRHEREEEEETEEYPECGDHFNVDEAFAGTGWWVG